MIEQSEGCYALHTAHTTYLFRKTEYGILEHLYYGKRIPFKGALQALCAKREFAEGNAVTYQAAFPAVSLENLCQEISGVGKGDVREPLIELTWEDGSRTSDFIFFESGTRPGTVALDTLPCAYTDEDENVETLCVKLKERFHDCYLELSYTVFYDTDVITRTTVFRNKSKENVKIGRLMSNQIDFKDDQYAFTSFHGAWTREMNRVDVPLTQGITASETKCGASSNRSNPFVMLERKNTTETSGECYGFHLVYSGNHLEEVEVNGYHKARFLQGIHPFQFSYLVEPGEKMEAPQAVMTFSAEGFAGMSHNLHGFIQKHIIRGYWKDRERPVLINSWESNYFKFKESNLLRLAKTAKDAGIELFVLDDGWFCGRNDDTTSLGDWQADLKKLPGGLKGLSDKLRAMGMSFGIWVEPEMVNVKSELYKMHPDWAVQIPGRDHAEGRNQRILDLTRGEVQEYLITQMTNVFTEGKVDYVKWDMNRVFSDGYSSALPAERQGEFFHRYVMGLYRVLLELTKSFPEILFEGCASGGNRFDLGILSYMPQIWASDNTDADCRARIQYAYSYGYPMSTVTSHVSGSPNHQTLRMSSVDTRFAVATGGILGYECNLCDLDHYDFGRIKEQILFYKKYRKVLQFGEYIRLREENGFQWMKLLEDKTQGILCNYQRMNEPNQSEDMLCIRELSTEEEYQIETVSLPVRIRDYGGLVNMVTPIHIRPGSLPHRLIDEVKQMPGEKEHYEGSGELFNTAGIYLQPSYSGTGFNDKTRHTPDFSARLYTVLAK